MTSMTKIDDVNATKSMTSYAYIPSRIRKLVHTQQIFTCTCRLRLCVHKFGIWPSSTIGTDSCTVPTPSSGKSYTLYRSTSGCTRRYRGTGGRTACRGCPATQPPGQPRKSRRIVRCTVGRPWWVCWTACSSGSAECLDCWTSPPMHRRTGLVGVPRSLETEVVGSSRCAGCTNRKRRDICNLLWRTYTPPETKINK